MDWERAIREAESRLESIEHHPMQYIESVMVSLESRDICEAYFDVVWDLPQYMNREMDEGQSLASMITFTGSVDAAWATTCGEYLQKIWPDTGMITLRAIEAAIKQKKAVPSFDGDFGVEVGQFGYRDNAQVKVQGSKRQIVQVAQQLAWMTGVFRKRSTVPPGVKIYSHFAIENKATDRFQLTSLPLEEAPECDASCWLPLLHGNVIAHGFPIPERGEEVGVEISLDATILLADIQYPLHIKDVTVFRGWSTLLYPIKASADFGSIQWHLVTSEDPEDPKLLESTSIPAYVTNWRDVGPDSLRSSRCFIGYCKFAEIHLGTKMFGLQSPLDKSGAKAEECRLIWQKKVTINIGTSGMGAFGFGATAEIGVSKTAKADMAARDNFKRVLDLSTRTSVLLYDVATSTAWLVPEISVILHITRSWFHGRKDLTKEALEILPSASIARDGSAAAMKAIEENEKTELKRTTQDWTWNFMEGVKESVRILKSCQGSRTRDESSSSASWLSSWFKCPRLYGWDLADLIDARDHTPRREVSIRKNSGDKWIKYIANHPNVLVLFCRNIDPPIRPAHPEKMCQDWNPIPSGENYLVASVQSLKHLARYCNGGDNGRQPTAECYWLRPRGSRPWAECDFEGKSGCNRLQRIVDKEPEHRPKICGYGALVFGCDSPPRRECRRPEIESLQMEEFTDDGSDLAHDVIGDQQTAEASDQKDQASIHDSSSNKDAQDVIRSFEDACRDVIVALVQRHGSHQSTHDIDVDELIREGQEIYDQLRLQAEKLLKQKNLVDEILKVVGSMSQNVQE